MVHCAVIKLVFYVKVKHFLVRADGTDEFDDVVRVQCAGLSWEATGKIRVANMDHTL